MVQKDEGEVEVPCPAGDDGGRAHLSGMPNNEALLTNPGRRAAVSSHSAVLGGKSSSGRRKHTVRPDRERLGIPNFGQIVNNVG
jgi:hypothetical protein